MLHRENSSALAECEEALRATDAENDRLSAVNDALRSALRLYADRRHHQGVGVSRVYNDGGREARRILGPCPTCLRYGDGLGWLYDGHSEPERCPDCKGAGYEGASW